MTRERPIPSFVSIEIRLWQLVTVIALVAVAAGVLIGHSFTGTGSAKGHSVTGSSTNSTNSVYKQQLERMRRQELKSAAQANVRAAVPAMEAFNADHGTYAGVRNIAIVRASASSYCIENTAPAGFTFHKSGPAGEILPGACA